MKLTTYNDITIETLRKTERPAFLVCLAAEQTQVMSPKGLGNDKELIKYLVKAEHHSPLEHALITFIIRGCSRSLLAQLTRQRTFKFTSSSQHYQDYRDYPCVIHPDFNVAPFKASFEQSFGVAYGTYQALCDNGVPKEEARQVLPNAAAVNLIITADARNLMYFFRQRRCERNVAEMIFVADALWAICKDWFPELFTLVGPPCVMGKCNQGKMKAAICKEPIEKINCIETAAGLIGE